MWVCGNCGGDVGGWSCGMGVGAVCLGSLVGDES